MTWLTDDRRRRLPAELQESAGADFVSDLAETFLEEAPRMLDAARRSPRAPSDADAFRRAAHSLKSNADTFGATRLAALARELELNARRSRERARAALDALAAEYARAAAALQGSAMR